MKKPAPPRPDKDFTVCSIAWDLDIVRSHTDAGFQHLPDALLYRRFFQFLDFIQRHGFTTRIIAYSLAEVTPSTVLRNSDLTNNGFRFIQHAQPRWSARMYKDRGEVAERRFLEKWLQTFTG